MSLIIGISRGNNRQRPAEPFPVADLSLAGRILFVSARANRRLLHHPVKRIVAWG